MLTSLKQRSCALLLGTTLAGCAAVGGVRSAAAVQLPVMRQGTLSPAAQQTLGAFLAGTPRYEQRLVLNAVRALGPERAEAQLSQLQAMPAAARQATGQLVTTDPSGSAAAVPPNVHRRPVRGIGAGGAVRDAGRELPSECKSPGRARRLR